MDSPRQLLGADSLEMGGSDSGREDGPLPEDQEAKTFESAIIDKRKPAARQEATPTSTSRPPLLDIMAKEKAA